MDELIRTVIASTVLSNILTVVICIFLIWRSATYVKRMERKVEDALAAENLRICQEIAYLKSEIDKRTHKAWFDKLDERVRTIEDVGLNEQWRNDLTTTLTKIGANVEGMGKEIAKLSAIVEYRVKKED